VNHGAAQETFMIIEAVADPNGDRFIFKCASLVKIESVCRNRRECQA
jgi:hypothetical protein